MVALTPQPVITIQMQLKMMVHVHQPIVLVIAEVQRLKMIVEYAVVMVRHALLRLLMFYMIVKVIYMDSSLIWMGPQY